ncbi:alanine--glyoxylate aminotransferase 2, mitochondrial-like [Symsagittifera roscoffensis]|uniref:alanine--glyoxylate aminotransferase 2, mitochondrial-like n=1 Tax=Symsagittifera roscoffensis TaxID=84072 RepID=UPI00307C8B55
MPAGPVPQCLQQTPNLSYEELLSIKMENLNRSLKTFFSKPLVLSSASMQWVFDIENKRYLDFHGGFVVISVGHCHPRLRAVLRDQIETLWHAPSSYTHPQIITYAQKLAAKLPDPLKVVYFVNSGSEAVDMAMLLARLASGNSDIVALRNAYHGTSMGALGLMAVPTWNYNVPNRHNIVHLGMKVDPYQGHYGGQNCRDSMSQVVGRPCDCSEDQCKASQLYVKEFQDTVSYMTSEKIAGFIVESIHGSVTSTKTSLSAFDDKRYILDDGQQTLPYGHKNIVGQTVIGIDDSDDNTAAVNSDPTDNDDLENWMPFFEDRQQPVSWDSLELN